MDPTVLPIAPKSAFTDFGHQLEAYLRDEYDSIQDELIAGDQKKDTLFSLSRSVFKNTGRAMFTLRTGGTDDVSKLLDSSSETIYQMVEIMGGNDQPRDGRFTNTIERYAEAKMFHYFFEYGVLAPPSSLKPCNDEEYIGAALGFAQELTRYVVGRASELNGKMLEFDFRNGHLRRKYDGLKYALKTIEEIIFELSLIDTSYDRNSSMDVSDDGNSTPMKRMRLENEIDRINVSEITAIRDRMDVYDKERERIIKLSRDVQKFAKQAIYSIHRNSLQDAQNKIDSAKGMILTITREIIAVHPSLRSGSFANSLEEWAEAVLFLEWIRGRKILLKSELGPFISTSEYVGALSDFTGEIGRLAVVLASQRQIVSVKDILQADLIISSYLFQFNVNGNYTKKLNAVNMNFKKVEDILYELTLQKMGGKALRRDPEPPAEEGAANSAAEETA